MRWTDRQRAMLEAMGLRLWAPMEATAAAAVAFEQVADADGDGDGASGEANRRVAGSPAPWAAGAGITAAGPDGVATSEWAALRAAVAACTACALSQSRHQTVFGVGHPQAHWMIVGEAPGEDEDRDGEPFVGKSGQLLDNMLRAIDLGREAPAGEPDRRRQVYIANSVKCRPPGDRNPEPDEISRCETFLARQIALVQPQLILAMGRAAVQSLLHSSEPLGRLRGRVHRAHGIPVIVTYHPAYLLRNLEEKARAWDDLCLAVETMRTVAA